jgi:hypothetical protein
VAARLSNEFHEEEQQKRERRKLIPARYQPGEQAERIRDFARSIGWDIGETEISLLMAGQRIALDGVFTAHEVTVRFIEPTKNYRNQRQRRSTHW